MIQFLKYEFINFNLYHRTGSLHSRPPPYKDALKSGGILQEDLSIIPRIPSMNRHGNRSSSGTHLKKEEENLLKEKWIKSSVTVGSSSAKLSSSSKGKMYQGQVQDNVHYSDDSSGDGSLESVTDLVRVLIQNLPTGNIYKLIGNCDPGLCKFWPVTKLIIN